MKFNLSELGSRERYKLLASAIVPRPIALVTTLGADGVCNAAPYSAFNYMSDDPPLVAIGLQIRDEDGPYGKLKDTTRNIAANDEFVVHLVDVPLAERMVECATEFPPDVSEPLLTGFTLEPSDQVKVPRLAECPVAMECRRVVMLNFSESRSVLIGEVSPCVERLLKICNVRYPRAAPSGS